MNAELKKIYDINGNRYFQEEIKFIQFKELVDLLLPFQELVREKNTALDIKEMSQLLGDNFSQAIAVILIPEGKTVREQNLEQTIADLEMAPLTQIEEIIEDFFSLNDLRSHAGRITRIIQNIITTEVPTPNKTSTGKKSSTRSAMETSAI